TYNWYDSYYETTVKPYDLYMSHSAKYLINDFYLKSCETYEPLVRNSKYHIFPYLNIFSLFLLVSNFCLSRLLVSSFIIQRFSNSDTASNFRILEWSLHLRRKLIILL